MAERILVIDDGEVILKLVQHRLSQEGYEVFTARDGDSGIALARSKKPDLILLDVQMPGKDGFEVCRELRLDAATRDTPIIMLTAMANIANKQAGFEAGADDYITKPFDNTELVLRVSANMRRKKRVEEEESKSKVITVFSLRGGAGTSSIATNLAVGLSEMWKTSTVMMDLALPTGLCDIMLNVKPKHGLHTMVHAEVSEISQEMIEKCLTRHPGGTKLLSGIIHPEEAEMVSDNLVSFLIDNFRLNSRYIVIDTSHNFSAPILAALDSADFILMPITPDINSIRLAVSTLKVFDTLGYPREKTQVVINWTFSKAGIATSRIEEFIKHPISMVIPHEPSIWSQAINFGEPVILQKSESPIISMMEDLVWRVSLPEDQQSVPVDPGEMWMRASNRMNSNSG